jgi:hypothetical protein
MLSFFSNLLLLKKKKRLKKVLVKVEIARLTFHHEPTRKILFKLDFKNPDNVIEFLTEVLITGAFNKDSGEFSLKYWDITNIETPILKQCYFSQKVHPRLIDCFRQFSNE